MHKRFLFGSSLVLIGVVIIVVYIRLSPATITRIPAGNHTILINESVISEHTTSRGSMQIRTLGFSNGLTIKVYNISDDTVLYFIEYLPVNRQSKSIRIISSHPSQRQFSYRYLKYKGTPEIKNNYWNTRVSKEEQLPISTIWTDTDALSLIDVFDRGQNQTLRENYGLSPPIKLAKNKYNWIYKMKLPGLSQKMVSCWGISSDKTLIDWETEKINQQIRLADFSRARKLTSQGSWDRVAPDYTPGDFFSFWWNPSQYVGEAFMRQDKEKSSIYTALAVFTMYCLIDRQNEDGFWETTPGSGWLKKDYRINPPYYDTRFSTNAGLCVLEGYTNYGDPLALNAAVKYGDYLSLHIERGRILNNQGVLCPDYWSNPSPVFLPHTSLNHQLAEMNYLYELYRVTAAPKYKAQGDKLRKGIAATGSGWIKPNGDLWYGIDHEGVYSRQDYEVLTLFDLIKTRSLLNKLNEPNDPTIDLLYNTKYKYAKKHGYIKW